jgi:hypothetical protein
LDKVHHLRRRPVVFRSKYPIARQGGPPAAPCFAENCHSLP